MTDKPYSRGQLIECETCGQAIAAYALKCVHCGKARTVLDYFDRQQLILLSLAIFSLALSMAFAPLVLVTLYTAYKLWKTAAPKEDDIEVNSSSNTSYDASKKVFSPDLAVVKKVVKKTVAIFGVLIVLFVIAAIIFSPSTEERASERGFISVQEYRLASEEGYESKSEYDVYLAELKRKEDAAIEAEKRRTATEAEEKRAAEDKKRAEPKNRAYAAKVVKHIKSDGNYGFIAIRNLDVQDFVGKSCAEALGYASINAPAKGTMGGTQVGKSFGYTVLSSRKSRNRPAREIASQSTEFSMAKPVPNYSMPSSCNLFASPRDVERSCNLDDPLYIFQAYKESDELGLVTEWGKYYCDGCGYQAPAKKVWRVRGPFIDEYPTGAPLVMITDEVSWTSDFTAPHYVCVETMMEFQM